MLQFNFVIPFLIAMALFSTTLLIHMIYRKNTSEILCDTEHRIEYLLDNLAAADALNCTQAENHKINIQTFRNEAAKEQQVLRNQLAESTQLNEDLQRTLTALRRHKANQRNNRKAQPRNHSQQGQSK